MTPEQVKARIEAAIPHSTAEVVEWSGGTDHYRVTVTSPDFEGQASLARHRRVMGLFRPEIDSGEVHALSIHTFTPAERARAG